MFGSNRFKKRWKSVLLAFVLLGAVCFPPAFSQPGSVAQAASLDDLKQRQEELERQQKENQKKLEQLRQDKEKQQEYQKALENQIVTVQSQVDEYNRQIKALDESISAKTLEISEKQAGINDRFEKLKDRLCAIYMLGEGSTLELLLNAQNVMDFADKVNLIQSITEHDTALIDGLKADMQSIAEQKQSIEGSRLEVAQAREMMDKKKDELTALQQEAIRLLNEISQNEKQTEEEKQKLDKEREEADAAIDKWFEDYYKEQERQRQQREEEERRRQEEQERNNSSSSQPDPQEPNNPGGGESGGSSSGSEGGSGQEPSGGQFTWPCPGYTNLSSEFGTRWGRMHKGIDIVGSVPGIISGKPVVAADGGTVVFISNTCLHNYPKENSCGCGGGYGNYMILDHGGGYSTLYGHCSSLSVTNGQRVQKGQIIGYAGSTGHSTGYHLHFEIRVNGTPKDPMLWFR